MTSLKALAERARDAPYHDPYAYRVAWDAFEAAASPAAILALLAENERLKAEKAERESLMMNWGGFDEETLRNFNFRNKP